jgi:hypothetical protein
MNNKIYIAIAAVVIAMVGFVFFSENDMDFSTINTNTVEKADIATVSKKENEAIEYSKNKSKHLKKVHKIKHKKKIKLPAKVKYRTSDRGGLYTIELIEESEASVGNGLSIPLKGIIDGKHFLVEVPKALINYDLKLKVTDRKTNESKEVALPFASELDINKNNPYMKIEFKDIANYTMNSTAKKNIFP